MDNPAQPVWMKDELVKDIDPRKLAFLEQMFAQGNGKNQKEMLTALMPMLKKAKQENLTFTTKEMNAAIAAVKKYSTAEEKEKIESLLEKAAKGKFPQKH